MEDVDLRTTLLRICTENVALVKLDAELVSLLENHEPVAWNLLADTWMKLLEATAAEKAKKRERQEEIDILKAECQELRNETKSATTALVKFKRTDLGLESEVLDLKTGVTSLMTRNNPSEMEASCLTRKISDLTNEQAALKRELRQENGQRRNEQHNYANKISKLEAKLDAQSRLRARNYAWGKLREEKDSLKREVQWLEDMLHDAEERVQDVRECSHCGKAL